MAVIELENPQVRSHYSALTLHRRCPQAWYYRYGLKLNQESTKPAPPRDFGSWWSVLRAAEGLERGRSLGSLKGPDGKLTTIDDGPSFKKSTVTVAEVLETAERFWGTLVGEVQEAWVDNLGEGLPGRLRSVYTSWRDNWEEDRKYERPIALEMFWERDLPRPKNDSQWTQVDPGLKMKLIGFIDEVYEDTRRGIIVARDHKTAKDIKQNSALDDMMDSQLALYAWGASPTLQQWGVPTVSALAYDRSKSTKNAVPRLTATGTLAKSATMYTLEEYLQFAAGPDGQGQPWGEEGKHYVSGAKKGQPKFGHYAADPKEVERLSTPAHRENFHARTLVPLSPPLVRGHLRAAVDTASDIWNTTRRAEQVQEATRNLGKSACQFCDYAPLCRAQLFGGPQGEYELAAYGLKARDGRTHV